MFGGLPSVYEALLPAPLAPKFDGAAILRPPPETRRGAKVARAPEMRELLGASCLGLLVSGTFCCSWLISPGAMTDSGTEMFLLK